ncbi:hypothetical protein O3Q52_12710, partial [Streptomyces sp. ActVer]|nr:hypothetical protein [Streptomyces sp. ActVer]
MGERTPLWAVFVLPALLLAAALVTAGFDAVLAAGARRGRLRGAHGDYGAAPRHLVGGAGVHRGGDLPGALGQLRG